MSYTEKLTICIPVYERYDYFEEAITSAISQTVKCKIIVSDNASSHSKFKDYCLLHGIQYYRNDTNLGVFANWNKCFSHSNTPYVTILGDDDILYQNYVESFLEAEEKFNGLDFYYTNINLLVNDEKKPWPHPAIYGLFDKNLKIIELGAEGRLGIPSIGGVWNKTIMLEHPFATDYYGSNDWLWLYLNTHKMKVYGNENVLLDYRQHDKQDNVSNTFITYYWSYPAIYYAMYEILNGKSVYAANALKQATVMANQSLIKFEFKFFDYYHSLNDDNLYKQYYKKISKLSFPIYLMTLPKALGYIALRLYFKAHYL
jgi:glycosyltransferase involved in cell wall biosynthesis